MIQAVALFGDTANNDEVESLSCGRTDERGREMNTVGRYEFEAKRGLSQMQSF